MTWIQLSPDERQEAWDYSEKVLAIVETKGPNYTGLTSPDRFFAGRLGEIGLRKWSEERGLEFRETVRDDGESDLQDFLFLFRKDRTARVNIKTTLHPNGIMLMHPVAQTCRIEKQDLLIGATGEDNGEGQPAMVMLWGVVPVKQFLKDAETKTIRVETRLMPLSKLPYSMEQFKNNCRRKK
jgi:hypothetical protein